MKMAQDTAPKTDTSSKRRRETKIAGHAVSQAPMAPSTVPPTAPQGHSHFLGMPPEVRNQIFEMILLDDQDDIVDLHSYFEPPALLQVNRQIRVETHCMYYARNTFLLNVSDCGTSILKEARKLQRDIRRIYASSQPEGEVFQMSVWKAAWR